MGLQLFSKEAIVMQYFLLLGLSLFSPCDSQMFFMASMPTKEQTMKHFLKVDANGDPITPDRIQSGRVPECDDGKTNLTIDWNGWRGDHQCLEDRWKPQTPKTAESCEPTKPRQAFHFCMDRTITYPQNPPTSGDHRPSWPVYGEYLYLPVQRWLHSMEHGAIVVLYHPCADKEEIQKLKSIVKGCIRRHIITPYNQLPKSTPYALLSWGCKLTLSSVDETAAVQFIQNFAKHGPEDLEMDGQFTDQLKEKAKVVSDIKDSLLCPKSASSGIADSEIIFMR